MGKIEAVKYFILPAVISLLASSCATPIKTSVKNDAELAGVKSFGVIEVASLRDSDVVSRALVSGLREKGFRVETGSVSDEGAVDNMGIKLDVDSLAYGYVVRIEHDSWVTRGEERIRVRETSTGTEERIRYDLPRVISNKTIHVRIKAVDEMGDGVIWDTEGYISDDAGADSVYMVESIVEKLLEQLPTPAPEELDSPVPSQPQSVAIGEKAPGFVARTVDGKQVALSDFKGKKVVVLNFWGVRCLPCLQEMPKLEDIYKRYKDRGMEMLGVNVDGVGADIIKKNLLKQLGGVELNVTYPLLPDEEFKIIDSYNLTVAPLTAVIDREGIIRYLHTDYQPGDEIELEEAIKRVLQ